MNKISEEPCAVKVAVRIRPLLKNETNNVLKTIEDEPQVVIVQDRRNIFAFDHVFHSDIKQNEVYEQTVKPLISKVLAGFNCTIIAYGQTGTGKTYTMGSDPQVYKDDVGLISRLLDDFFKYTNLNAEVSLSVSFIEIYNEKVFDLLGTRRSFLNVKGFRVQNMTSLNVNDSAEAIHWLHVGSTYRHTGHTALNNNSSRSHAVFTVYVTNSQGTMSKIHLVDLAGSESVRRTGTEGKAFKEGITINKGLLTVGRVISALSNGDKVVPYRDSMLTTILQDSLNIKNYVALVACISPNIDDVHETLATLRFAETTKSVKSRPQLETIALEFEKLHPGILEKISFGPTPFKRKANSVSLSTIKKRRPNYSFTPFLSSTGQLSSSSPKLFDHDTLSISTSTAIEPEPLSYSPLVKRCTEALQNTMFEQINTIVKTQLSQIIIPLEDKENQSENTLWQEISNQIPKKTPNTDEKAQLSSRRALDFDTNSPEPHPTNEIPKINSPIFKIPSIKPVSAVAPRKSTRLSSINTNESHFESPNINNLRPNGRSPILNEENKRSSDRFKNPVRLPRKSTRVSMLRGEELNFQSPVMLRPQRRSIRISMRKSMAPVATAVPTPAPRTIRVNKRGVPTPAPRTFLKPATPGRKKKMPKTNLLKEVQKNKNNRRKSVRSQHYDYILETINNGTIAELKMLPTIGDKTAFQISTYRNIYGQFESLDDFGKMPAWRGKSYQRFMLANHLESFIVEK